MKIGEEIKSVLLSELLSEIGYEILAAHVSMHFEKFGDMEKGVPVNHAYMYIRKRGEEEKEFVVLYPEYLNVDVRLWDEKCIPSVYFDDLYVSVMWDDCYPIIRWFKAINKELEIEVFGEKIPKVDTLDEMHSFSYDIVRKCLEK